MCIQMKTKLNITNHVLIYEIFNFLIVCRPVEKLIKTTIQLFGYDCSGKIVFKL